jgi:hypothetical protein
MNEEHGDRVGTDDASTYATRASIFFRLNE